MARWLKLFRLAGVLAATFAASPSGAQQVAGSVEAGLQALAQNLLASAPADRRPPLSVLPFPGADQSCPILSVFVVDELTTTFITAVQPRPRVVERQQLEAIIAQNQLDEFLTDPEQRQRLGGLSGIGAVVLGTFAPIGDRLRINARMVAIDNGETIGAASVSVPRTREMEDLLRQGSGRGLNCLPNVRPAGAATPRPGAARPATSAPMGAAAPQPSRGNCEQEGPLEACVVSLTSVGNATDRSGSAVTTLVMRLRNTGEVPIGVVALQPWPHINGTDGSQAPIANRGVGGLAICDWDTRSCLKQADRSQMSSIPAGRSTNVTLRFQGALGPDAEATVAASLGYFVGRESTGDLTFFPISIDSLRPAPAARR